MLLVKIPAAARLALGLSTGGWAIRSRSYRRPKFRVRPFGTRHSSWAKAEYSRRLGFVVGPVVPAPAKACAKVSAGIVGVVREAGHGSCGSCAVVVITNGRPCRLRPKFSKQLNV